MESLQPLCISLFRTSAAAAVNGQQSPEQKAVIVELLRRIGNIVREACDYVASQAQIANQIAPMVVQSISMFFQKDPFVRHSLQQRESCLDVLSCALRLQRSAGLAAADVASTSSTGADLLSSDTFMACVACCDMILNKFVGAPGTSPDSSEEEQTLICKIILELLELLDVSNSKTATKTSTQLLEQLLSWQSFGTRIGFWVSVLLQFVRAERSGELRAAALSCIRRLFTPFDVVGTPQTIPYLWRFVPGVSSKLFQTIKSLSEGRRYTAVLVQCVELWGYMLTTVFRSSNPNALAYLRKKWETESASAKLASIFAAHHNSIPEGKEDTPSDAEATKEQTLPDDQSAADFFSRGGSGADGGPPEAWFEETIQKLCPVLRHTLVHLRTHINRGAQLAGVHLAAVVVGDCGLCLLQSVPDCLEYVLGIVGSTEGDRQSQHPSMSAILRKLDSDIRNVRVSAVPSAEHTSSIHARSGVAAGNIWSFVYSSIERKLQEKLVMLPRLARVIAGERELQFTLQFITHAISAFSAACSGHGDVRDRDSVPARAASAADPLDTQFFMDDTSRKRINAQLEKQIPTLCGALCEVALIDVENTVRGGIGELTIPVVGDRGVRPILLDAGVKTQAKSRPLHSTTLPFQLRFQLLSQTESIQCLSDLCQQLGNSQGARLAFGAWDVLFGQSIDGRSLPSPQALYALLGVVAGVQQRLLLRPRKEPSSDQAACLEFLRHVTTQTSELLAARPSISPMPTATGEALSSMGQIMQRALSAAMCVVLAGGSFVAYASAISTATERLSVDEMLADLLFPLLEHLADSQLRFVAATAFEILDRIAVAMMAGTSDQTIGTDTPSGRVGALLVENIDYLMDSLAFQLENVSEYPRAPDTLAALWSHAGTAAHPLLRDTVRGVLRSVDYQHGYLTSIRDQVTERLLVAVQSCTKVLAAEAQKSSEGLVEAKQQDTEASNDDWVGNKLQSIAAFTVPSGCTSAAMESGTQDNAKSFFTKYHEQKKKSDKNPTNRPDFETDSDDDDEAEGQVQHPTEYLDVESVEERERAKLLSEVLSRCINFLTWPRRRVQLVLLHTVEAAMRALYKQDELRAKRIVEAEAKIDEERATSKASWGRDVEFQNDPRLLPAIHGIWPSLAPLLRDVAGTADSHVVFSAALRVLVCLVECASSFIRNRFQKDVWPQMRRHLTQLLAWARPRMNLSPTANTRGIDVAVAEMLQSRSEESAVEARRIRERKASSAGVMLLARPGAGEVVERLQAPIAQNLLCKVIDFLKVAAQHQLELPGDVLRTITTVALDAMGTAHVQIVRESAYDLLRQLLRYQADSIWLQIAQAARCSRCEPNVAVQAQPQAREVFAPVVVCDVAKTADHDQVLCERAQRLLEFAANLPEPAPKEEFPAMDYFQFGGGFY